MTTRLPPSIGRYSDMEERGAILSFDGKEDSYVQITIEKDLNTMRETVRIEVDADDNTFVMTRKKLEKLHRDLGTLLSLEL